VTNLPRWSSRVGIDHRHSYDQVQSLLDVGGTCVGW